MRTFSLLLISTFALAVSIPNSASSGELVKDNDCGWVSYCPGQEEEPQCPEGMKMGMIGGALGGEFGCVPDSSTP